MFCLNNDHMYHQKNLQVQYKINEHPRGCTDPLRKKIDISMGRFPRQWSDVRNRNHPVELPNRIGPYTWQLENGTERERERGEGSIIEPPPPPSSTAVMADATVAAPSGYCFGRLVQSQGKSGLRCTVIIIRALVEDSR